MENIAFVNFYLEINGDVNLIDKKGRNALHYLAMNDNTEILKIILDEEIYLDQKDFKNGQTPVFFAMKYNSFKVLRILLIRGANVNENE